MGVQNSYFLKYLKESEKNELEYSGIEADMSMDNDISETDAPYEVQNIRIDQKVITIFQMEHWISAGSLNLSPEYQRNMVWDEQRKSALIESLLLRIPIPSFYLDEDGEGNKSVIDGMQRLSTIHSFLNNEFSLRKMQYLSDCEEKKFGDLGLKLRRRIEDTELTVNILDERCPEIVKFDIFRRVNTGGIPLNYQEIRNILALPRVRLFLQNMVACEEFQQATRGSVKDIRMGAQELCLRCLTILVAYDWEKRDFKQYHGLLKMMDQMILVLNKRSQEELENILLEFRKIMASCHEILGEYSFCKLDNTKINKSLFTGWVVVLDNIEPDPYVVKARAERLRSAYKERLEQDADFYNAITSSTGTRKNILKSIAVIRELWEECYD